MIIRLLMAILVALQSVFGMAAQADSFLVPSIRLVRQMHDPQAILLDVELSHPGIRHEFTGILLDIICTDHGSERSRLVLVGPEENRIANRTRSAGLSVAANVALPESLKPGQVQGIRIVLARMSDPETGRCTRIAVRGAW